MLVPLHYYHSLVQPVLVVLVQYQLPLVFILELVNEILQDTQRPCYQFLHTQWLSMRLVLL